MASEWPLKTIAECATSEAYSTQIGPFGKALMASEYTLGQVPPFEPNVRHELRYARCATGPRADILRSSAPPRWGKGRR